MSRQCDPPATLTVPQLVDMTKKFSDGKNITLKVMQETKWQNFQDSQRMNKDVSIFEPPHATSQPLLCSFSLTLHDELLRTTKQALR
jgi:hypothetical protein